MPSTLENLAYFLGVTSALWITAELIYLTAKRILEPKGNQND